MSGFSTQRGFTLVELLITTALFGIITAAVMAIVEPARDLVAVQPEAQDVQQRLRFGVSTVQQTLAFAGPATTTGPYSGAALRAFAAIRPYRIGDRNPDPPLGIFYRADALSVMTVPGDAIPARIRAISATPPVAIVEVDPNCSGAAVCGFPIGSRVAAFDVAGRSWFGTVRNVQGMNVEVEAASVEPVVGPQTGALLVVVDHTTFALGVDRASGIPRLTVYDGHLSDSPLLDHVVRFSAELVGVTSPPTVFAEDAVAPWLDATYGPPPPGATVDVEADSWPAGENCTFAMLDGRHVSRLIALGGAPLAVIPPSMLTDGPWCPDAASPNRFDADLLRIRRIDVSLRVQVAVTSMRGPLSLHFFNAGTGRRGSRLVPDREIRFAVTPRNLSSGASP